MGLTLHSFALHLILLLWRKVCQPDFHHKHAKCVPNLVLHLQFTTTIQKILFPLFFSTSVIFIITMFPVSTAHAFGKKS